jgi:hypothetical protein
MIHMPYRPYVYMRLRSLKPRLGHQMTSFTVLYYKITFFLEPTIGIEPMASSLPRKRSTPELRGPKMSQSQWYFVYLTNHQTHSGAGNGIRTRDPQLGRLML